MVIDDGELIAAICWG